MSGVEVDLSTESGRQAAWELAQSILFDEVEAKRLLDVLERRVGTLPDDEASLPSEYGPVVTTAGSDLDVNAAQPAPVGSAEPEARKPRP